MYESEYTAHAWMQQEKLKLKLSGFEQYVIKIGLDVMDSKTYVAQCILLIVACPDLGVTILTKCWSAA